MNYVICNVLIINALKLQFDKQINLCLSVKSVIFCISFMLSSVKFDFRIKNHANTLVLRLLANLNTKDF